MQLETILVPYHSLQPRCPYSDPWGPPWAGLWGSNTHGAEIPYGSNRRPLAGYFAHRFVLASVYAVRIRSPPPNHATLLSSQTHTGGLNKEFRSKHPCILRCSMHAYSSTHARSSTAPGSPTDVSDVSASPSFAHKMRLPRWALSPLQFVLDMTYFPQHYIKGAPKTWMGRLVCLCVGNGPTSVPKALSASLMHHKPENPLASCSNCEQFHPCTIGPWMEMLL